MRSEDGSVLTLRLFAFSMLIFCSTSLSGSGWQTEPIQDTGSYVSPFRIRNERCLKCHGQERYENSETAMPQKMIVSREAFYRSNHKSFKCTDCHSEDFSVYPHAEELREEIHFNCLDCHGGDPVYAQFKFEEISAEYQKSVHYKLEEEGFTCWECHDPHSFKNTMRKSKKKTDAIGYDNSICLNCHSDRDRFGDISKKHILLQDPGVHFTEVGCLECHTQPNDSLPVPHLVMSKEKALRNCDECHSKHSPVAASMKIPEQASLNKDFIIFVLALFMTGVPLLNILRT